MFRTTFARSLGIIGLTTVLAAPLAWAQQSPPVRVRGTIERVEGAIYVIKTRDGAELKLTVQPALFNRYMIEFLTAHGLFPQAAVTG